MTRPAPKLGDRGRDLSRLEKVKRRMIAEGMSIYDATHAAMREVFG